jgi:hypothetical protein
MNAQLYSVLGKYVHRTSYYEDDVIQWQNVDRTEKMVHSTD